MNKYEILKEKLNDIITYLDNMKVEHAECLLIFKGFIKNRIESIDNRTIRDSNGALFGLTRGVAEYDEICADDQLFEMLADADDYYSQECEKF